MTADDSPLEPPVTSETMSGAREFADILRPLGCACSNRIEARCGQSTAKLFAGVDIEGRTFSDMALSLGMPPQEARAMLDLARAEVVAMLCQALARPSENSNTQQSATGGCACSQS
jgi:hypothetical protein